MGRVQEGGCMPLISRVPPTARLAVRLNAGGVRIERGLRARAWWLIRRERVRITVDGLLYTLATGKERGARENIRRYLGELERAGVLERSAKRLPVSGAEVWRLVRDLGPLVPVWRKAERRLHDPNGGTLLPRAAHAAQYATQSAEVCS